MNDNHPVLRSIKEQLAAARPDAQVSHTQLLLMVEVMRTQLKPQNPDSAEAIHTARRILARVHDRIARELRQHLPPPAGMALLLNMAAGVRDSLQPQGVAVRLSQHLLAQPNGPERLPLKQTAELCRLLAAGEAPPGAATPPPPANPTA